MQINNTDDSKHFSSRIDAVGASKTTKTRSLANAMKKNGLSVINFAAGELDFSPPDSIILSAQKALPKEAKYTETLGAYEVRQSIANFISQSTSQKIVPEEVGLTVGAKHALFNVSICLMEEGDEVVIPSPSWETLVSQVRLMNATPILIDTEQRDFQLTFHDFEKALSTKTKAVIINSPNNPTGVIYKTEELEKIIRKCYENGILIVSDECYSALVRENKKQTSLIELAPYARNKVIMINSFSKSHAITGWRVGYVVTSPKLINIIGRIQGHMTSNICSIAQGS